MNKKFDNYANCQGFRDRALHCLPDRSWLKCDVLFLGAEDRIIKQTPKFVKRYIFDVEINYIRSAFCKLAWINKGLLKKVNRLKKRQTDNHNKFVKYVNNGHAKQYSARTIGRIVNKIDKLLDQLRDETDDVDLIFQKLLAKKIKSKKTPLYEWLSSKLSKDFTVAQKKEIEIYRMNPAVVMRRWIISMMCGTTLKQRHWLRMGVCMSNMLNQFM